MKQRESQQLPHSAGCRQPHCQEAGIPWGISRVDADAYWVQILHMQFVPIIIFDYFTGHIRLYQANIH